MQAEDALALVQHPVGPFDDVELDRARLAARRDTVARARASAPTSEADDGPNVTRAQEQWECERLWRLARDEWDEFQEWPSPPPDVDSSPDHLSCGSGSPSPRDQLIWAKGRDAVARETASWPVAFPSMATSSASAPDGGL